MEESKMIKMIVGVIIGVIIAFYAGAMFNFFPFMVMDLTIAAIGYSTMIICVVIAVCACVIISDKKEQDK